MRYAILIVRRTAMRAWPFEDCLLLVDPSNRSIHALNPSGSFLWELLQSGSNEAEAAREFAALYNISPETADADVWTALTSWRSQGLLKRGDFDSGDTPIPSESGSPPVSWTSRNYSIANISFTVSVSNEELLHAVERRLALFRCDDVMQTDHSFALVANGDGTVTLVKDGMEIARDEAGAVPTILAGEIIGLFFPDAVRNASLHAAAVGMQDKCVLFAGASNSGKSTLSASLSRCGFNLLTDDIVWLEGSTLDVLAVPFAIKLREGSWSVLQKEYPEIASLPVLEDYGDRVKYLSPAQGHVRRATATAFVFVHYDPTHAACLRPVSAFESLAGLQNAGFWVEPDDGTMQIFLQWFEKIPRFDLAWSDAAEVARLMAQLLDSVASTKTA